MLTTLSESDRAALREEVKREVKEELGREDRTRRARHALGCFTVYFIFLGLPLIFVAVMLTRSGLVRLPILTSSLYRPVAPTRVVAPLVGETAEVAWRESLAGVKYEQTTGLMTMTMDENRLTTIVRQGFANQASALPFKANDAQIALDRDRAELFFYTIGLWPNDGERVPVRLTFVPNVDASGGLAVEVTEVVIGGASVPAVLRAPMASLFNSFLRNEFTSQMPAGFAFRSLQVQPEGLTIIFTAPSR